MKHIKYFEDLDEDLNNELLKSIKNCDFDNFKYCINKGADVNFYTINTDTFPLLNTVENDLKSSELKNIRYDMAKILLDKGAIINKITYDRFSTLLLASETEPYFDIIKLLIEYGADWNMKNMSNEDFIDVLINNDNKLFVDELIEKYPEKYEEYLIKKNQEKYNL